MGRLPRLFFFCRGVQAPPPPSDRGGSGTPRETHNFLVYQFFIKLCGKVFRFKWNMFKNTKSEKAGNWIIHRYKKHTTPTHSPSPGC